MAQMSRDSIKEIEFLTVYPNKDGSNTLLATATTREGYRALLYAPIISRIDLEMEDTRCYTDIRDIRGFSLTEICTQRGLKIDGTVYASHDHKHDEEWYFKVMYLDGPCSKKSIDKADIEKLFGCEING